MNKRPFIWSLIFLISFTFSLSAQKFSVKTHIDSTSLWIGNQTKLSFEVTQPKNIVVVAPVFSDTLIGGIEIVERLKNDTAQADNGNIRVTHAYNITAFNDSLVNIPSYPFSNEKDTVWSNSLSLQVVQPFQIDTATAKIKDIKPVYNASIYWWGIIRSVLIVLLIAALLIVAFFVFRKYFKKNPELFSKKAEPVLPAHIVALNKLDKIKEDKPWQRNRSKEYHTELTDIVREYIEHMFSVNSMEMTSEEILEQLRFLKFEQKTAYTTLEQILKLADLVKFAKFEPQPAEHEMSLMNAYLFINQTKVEETVTATVNEESAETDETN